MCSEALAHAGETKIVFFTGPQLHFWGILTEEPSWFALDDLHGGTPVKWWPQHRQWQWKRM